MRRRCKRTLEALRTRAASIPLDLVVAAGSVLAILIVTLYPFSFQDFGRIGRLAHYFEGIGQHGMWGRLGSALTPIFSDPGSPPLIQLEPVANVLLFMPLGFATSSLIAKRGVMWITTILGAFVLCSGLSLLVEVLQVFLPSRHPAFTDVMTNSLGGCLGATGFLLRNVWWNGATLRISARVWRSLLVAYTGFVLLLSLYLGFETHSWSLSNWNPSFPLVVGNEATGDRPWRGTVSSFFLTDRAFSSTEVDALLASDGDVPSRNDLLVIFPFRGNGYDGDSARHRPLRTWRQALQPEALTELRVRGSHPDVLTNDSSVASMTRRIRATSRFTLGATFTTEDTRQRGPARIVSLSQTPTLRNVTVAQQHSDLIFRVRTPFTGLNGTAVFFRAPGFFQDDTSQRIVVTYRPSTFTLYAKDPGSSGENVPAVSYTVEISPETKALWFFRYLWTGPFAVNLTHNASWWPVLFYYGFTLFPLGFLFGRVLATSSLARSKTVLLALGGNLLGPLLLQVLLTQGFTQSPTASYLILGMLMTGAGLTAA